MVLVFDKNCIAHLALSYRNEGMGGVYEEIFEPTSGFYGRGDILEGPDKGKDPFMRNFPALMDVGVMGHCEHGRSGLCEKAGIQCYQNGATRNTPNMTLENFQKLVDEASGKCFQFALGGCGDPDMYENFEELLKYARTHRIVPNFTTSGIGMTEEKAALCKQYCGAVAVSMYSRLESTVPEIAWRPDKEKHVFQGEDDIPVLFALGGFNKDCVWDAPNYVIDGKRFFWDELHHVAFGSEERGTFFRVFNESRRENNYTMRAIQLLLDAGVQTNIHYVLSKNTIDEAIIRLKYNGFPLGVHAIVFLLHKPVGQGQDDLVLSFNDPRLKEFFSLVDNYDGPYQIGFDSCTIPGLLNVCQNIEDISMEACEGARFSMYVTPDMKALPCSFDNVEQRWAFDMNGKTIQEAWESPAFEAFRDCHRRQCPNCKKRDRCFGGCPICPSIVLCGDKH